MTGRRRSHGDTIVRRMHGTMTTSKPPRGRWRYDDATMVRGIMARIPLRKYRRITKLSSAKIG